MNAWTLEGKKALITGATKGLGRAIAREFAEFGAELFIVARTGEDVDQMTEEFAGEGHNIHGFTGDISSEDIRTNLIAGIKKQWDKLDILVNNVGSNVRKPTLQYTTEDLRTVMKINVESAFDLSIRLHPLLKKSIDPVILNISSVTSQQMVQISSAAYTMSKAAMEEMTNFMAVEWGKDNIRVNSLHPWFIETPFTKQILDDPEKRKAIITGTPLGKVGEPEDVAHAAAFLAMPAAKYISGANLPIDGAFSKKGI